MLAAELSVISQPGGTILKARGPESSWVLALCGRDEVPEEFPGEAVREA